jgi:single-strand DNA-binding protein
MYFKGTAIGRLTKDPKLRKTKTDKSVCNFTIAVNNPFSKTDDDTQFVKVTCWNGQAEAANNNLGKGRLVMVQGDVKLEEFQSNTSDKILSDIVITANEIRYLDFPDGKSVSKNHKRDIEKLDGQKENISEDNVEDFDTEDYTDDEDAYDFDVPF